MANYTGEVITIDNFDTVMSKLNPNDTLFALVDMGSNGIRFSISDLSEPQSRLLPCLYSERAGISLYDALHDSKPDSRVFHFSSEIISTVSAILARFRGICDSFGVSKNQISVFATEAMRTSVNRDEMLAAIKTASGLNVQLLSPAMESLFGAMGARTGFDHVDGLFMDLGGGSVQMTYVNSRTEGYYLLAAKAAQSMPYGAAKVSAAINSMEAPVMRKDLQGLMKKTFDGLKEQFPKLKAEAESSDGVTIYFCGGGFRGYGSMLMHTHEISPYPIPNIGGFTVLGSKFVKWEDMLTVNENYKGKIYGLSKRRREQFHAIVTVVEALVDAVPNIKQVVFCSGGNREGVLYMKLPKSARETFPLSILPGGSSTISKDSLYKAEQLVLKALTTACPKIFTLELRGYVIRNTWVNMGDPTSINAAKALQNPISGVIAGRPGLTHETRAILSLVMCARWGTDISPCDHALYDSLRKLIGDDLSFWCEYFGTIVRLLAIIVPGYGAATQSVEKIISLKGEMSTNLGKKGKHVGVLLEIEVDHKFTTGVDSEAISDLFKKVGDGTGKRVEVKFI